MGSDRAQADERRPPHDRAQAHAGMEYRAARIPARSRRHTGVETLRKRLSKKSEAEGRTPITITAFLMKTLAAALKKFPQMNSSVDLANEKSSTSSTCTSAWRSIPIAACSCPSFATSIRRTSTRSPTKSRRPRKGRRNRKLSLDDMQGGSITISNSVVSAAAPLRRSSTGPRWRSSASRAREWSRCTATASSCARFLMPLTLSYDHRVIDGADGVRILRWIVEAIEQPALIWLDQLKAW